MNKKLRGHLAVLFVNIFWGLNIPVTKSILSSGITPFGWSLLRSVFACSCFWLTASFLPKEKITRRADYTLLFFCALFGLALNQLPFVIGLSLTSPIDASIITTSVPVMVMIIAALVLKEPITPLKITGVLTGAAGALLLIVSGTATHTASNTLQGDLLCVLSCLSYAVYLVISKPLSQRYSPVTIMKWTFLFSTLLFCPFGWSEMAGFQYGNFDTQLWLKISFSLCLGTFIPFLLIPLGLKYLRPTTMSMYNYIQPLVASVVAIIVLQDSFTWVKCGAAVLVFTGVYLVNRSKSRVQAEAEKTIRES